MSPLGSLHSDIGGKRMSFRKQRFAVGSWVLAQDIKFVVLE